jgi:hypothetical protein
MLTAVVMLTMPAAIAAADRSARPQLKVRLPAYYGGSIGHRVKGTIRISDDAGHAVSQHDSRSIVINHSYRKVSVTLRVPTWAQLIGVTLQLRPNAGASTCAAIADHVVLEAFKA